MITPLDIENKKFTKQMMKGYNVDEVDDFLDELTLEYGKLYKENAELKAQREELDTNVGKYKNIENTIQNMNKSFYLILKSLIQRLNK